MHSNLPASSRLGCLFSPMISQDISAARHADVLFVKEKADGENDLSTYCKRENIKHLLFSDFSQAVPTIASIVTGEKTVQDILG